MKGFLLFFDLIVFLIYISSRVYFWQIREYQLNDIDFGASYRFWCALEWQDIEQLTHFYDYPSYLEESIPACFKNTPFQCFWLGNSKPTKNHLSMAGSSSPRWCFVGTSAGFSPTTPTHGVCPSKSGRRSMPRSRRWSVEPFIFRDEVALPQEEALKTTEKITWERLSFCQ